VVRDRGEGMWPEDMSWDDAIGVVCGRKSWWYEMGIRCWVSDYRVYLMRMTRDGWPLETSCLDVFYDEPRHVIPLVEGEARNMLRRRADRNVEGEAKAALKAGAFETAHKALWSYMTDCAWDDGSPREPASLLIFMQDGQMKGMLRDKAEGLCLWASASGIAELLGLLDIMIEDPETVWRVDRQQPGQAAKRRPGGGRRSG